MALPLVEEPPAPHPTPVEEQPIATPYQIPAAVPAHPLTNDIIRQVEYYFSDENLPTDPHLLGKCGGRENRPVSIRSICGFKKMRQYKPFSQVVESLKKSAFLDVLPDKTVRRKIPLQCKTVLDPDFNQESDTEAAPQVSETLKAANSEAKTQPKAQTQPQQQPKARGWDKAHGFEEFFADAPVTPADYKEELSMYDPATDFRLRTEIAIQRFRSRRNMHEKYSAVFARFMKYGGIDSSPRQFTGKLSDQDFEDRDPADKALMLATYTIDLDKDDPNAWPVDFEGVAKGFLSSHWPQSCYFDLESIERATRVIKNFFNYLLHHNVCPEYLSDLYAARKVCDQANIEFPKITELAHNLPDEFNISCSLLCNGYHADTLVPRPGWDCGERNEEIKFVDNPEAKARLVLTMAVTTLGNEAQAEMLRKYQAKEMPITFVGSDEDVTFEVTGVELPSAENLALYDKLNKTVLGNKDFTVKPLGKLYGKHVDLPNFAPPDLPKWRHEEIRKSKVNKTYEFWLEAELLENCFVGMKMCGMLRQVNFGFQVLEQVHNVLASFYTCLPNELLTKWKEPVFLTDAEMMAKLSRHDILEDSRGSEVVVE
ncbi:Argonaute siRNA chaperone complex subunit Arb1-domain-containing protein, partial [Phyllosticta citribraziliensis]